jgi:peptidoglycan-N-acetylglucosamine deacetylase
MWYWTKTNWFVKKIFSNYVWDIPNSDNKVFLTFDDGPTPEITEWVLDELKKHHAKATFFCIGNNIEKHPEILKKVIDDGHAMGNHTYNHANGWKTSVKDYLCSVQCSVLSVQEESSEKSVQCSVLSVQGESSEKSVQFSVLSEQGERSEKSVQCSVLSEQEESSEKSVQCSVLSVQEESSAKSDQCSVLSEQGETSQLQAPNSKLPTSISKLQTSISKIQTSNSQLFRPPYGKITLSQSRKMRQLGYKIIMWDVLSADFDIHITPEKCLENVISTVVSGSIIVFHDSKKALPNLKYALPKTLKFLAERGFVCDVISI